MQREATRRQPPGDAPCFRDFLCDGQMKARRIRREQRAIRAVADVGRQIGEGLALIGAQVERVKVDTLQKSLHSTVCLQFRQEGGMRIPGDEHIPDIKHHGFHSAASHIAERRSLRISSSSA